MPKVEIILPDNSSLFFDTEPSVLDVAEKLGPRLAKDTVGAQIDNLTEVIDLRQKLKNKFSL